MYTRKQFAWSIFWFTMPVVAVISIISVIFLKELRTEMLVVLIILLFVLVLFKDLTVSVDEEKVGLEFGSGFIHKEFLLKDIKSCEKVKNRWYYGWGLRYGRNFILYNVSGLDAVELHFKSGRKKVRIGTAEPDELCEAIHSRIDPHE